MCNQVTIQLNILGNLVNPLDFNAQSVLTIDGVYSGLTAYYTINNGTTQYNLTTGTTVHTHVNEGNVFNYYITYNDNCVNDPIIVPQLVFDPDSNPLAPFYYLSAESITTGTTIVYGCTNEFSPNYNPLANVDDGSCEDPIYGCTDPTSFNYNSAATIDDNSCVDVVSGCTNPQYAEYNPLANVDDGSCQNLVQKSGCTNPRAVNYDPAATTNDGSCYFLSGCTNPLASNYNEDAVVDDGSCMCDNFNILFNLSGETGTTLTTVENYSCSYYVEFDLLLKAMCSSILDYVISKDSTVLDVLNQLKVNFNVHKIENSEKILIQETPLWSFSIDSNFNKTGIFLFDQNEQECNTLYDLLSLQLGFNCLESSEQLFGEQWNTYQIKINDDLVGQTVQLSLNLEGFSFINCILIDNFRLYKTCQRIKEECVLIPKRFGFDLERVIDNKKVWLFSNEKVNRQDDVLTNYYEYNPKLLFNSKEIDLKINVPKYIDNDVISYLNANNQYVDENKLRDLTFEKVQFELIDVRNQKVVKQYDYLIHVYNLYQKSLDLCAVKSKELNVGYIFSVLEKIGTNWLDLLTTLVPMTSIWNASTHYYTSSIFYPQKFQYKRYTIDKGSLQNATISCSILSDDICEQTYEFKSDYEQIINENNLCISGDGITYSYIDDGSYFGARLVQYYESGDTYITNINYPNTSYSGCTCNQVEVEIIQQNTTEIAEDQYQTIVIFTTVDVDDISQISATINGSPYPITTFDAQSSGGTIVFEPIACENEVIIQVERENCGQDIDTLTFNHCYITTPVIVTAESNPFFPTITIAQIQFYAYCITDVYNNLYVEVNSVEHRDQTVDLETYLVTLNNVFLNTGSDNEITITVQTICGEITETFNFNI